MSDSKKNEGIIMSGGTIKAKVIAVGKKARAELHEQLPKEDLSQEGADSASEALAAEESSKNREYLSRLSGLISSRFSKGELRALGADVGVDYDDLPEGGKSDKARELVAYLERRDRLDSLLVLAKARRPNADWPESPSAE